MARELQSLPSPFYREMFVFSLFTVKVSKNLLLIGWGSPTRRLLPSMIPSYLLQLILITVAERFTISESSLFGTHHTLSRQDCVMMAFRNILSSPPQQDNKLLNATQTFAIC